MYLLYLERGEQFWMKKYRLEENRKSKAQKYPKFYLSDMAWSMVKYHKENTWHMTKCSLVLYLKPLVCVKEWVELFCSEKRSLRRILLLVLGFLFLLILLWDTNNDCLKTRFYIFQSRFSDEFALFLYLTVFDILQATARSAPDREKEINNLVSESYGALQYNFI